MRIAASRLSPAGRPSRSRSSGSSTHIPTSPYTTDGIPASTPTAGRTSRASHGGAAFARNRAVRKPSGTPMAVAPAAP